MSSGKDYIAKIMAQVEARNANQPEFLQAVDEVLATLAPALDRNPKFEANTDYPQEACKRLITCVFPIELTTCVYPLTYTGHNLKFTLGEPPPLTNTGLVKILVLGRPD